MALKNYYTILEIQENATLGEIKKAFRVLAIKYHPDKNFGSSFFSERFIEIKEAYDQLSNSDSRKAYDIEYAKVYKQSTSIINEEIIEQKKKKQEFEEQFFYEPFKPFFSSRDREEDNTPQFKPLYDLLGNKISDDIDFFILPNKIGKMLYAYSDLRKDSPINNPNFKKSFSEKIFGISEKKLTHVNFFVGINGFAIYECKQTKNNIIAKYEVSFREVTDLYTYLQDNVHNFSYQWTDFVYMWIDQPSNYVKWGYSGEFNKKSTIQEHQQLNLCRAIEKSWNIYLLDNLEKNLETKNYVSFSIYNPKIKKFESFIQMGIGYITFIDKKKGNFTYKFNDIKNIYSKENDLIIQHNNFEKTLFFFKSGNENKIPLLNLCNRNFFFKVLQLFLGFKDNN